MAPRAESEPAPVPITSRSEPSHQKTEPHPSSQPPAPPDDPASDSSAGRSSSLTASKSSRSVRIYPRRKPSKPVQAALAFKYRTSPSAPVTLTAELVASLAPMSLAEAADALGISMTALKQGCRRLGMPRWPGASARGSESSSSSAAAVALAAGRRRP
mmetsp:Transcript_55561/g.146573  ORF Transcript_55561/g.146573 Transcript_55561/m.146573 type:complete len:158 (-) Transcript_55561:481-954(-)